MAKQEVNFLKLPQEAATEAETGTLATMLLCLHTCARKVQLSPIDAAKTFIVSAETQEKLDAEIQKNEVMIAHLSCERTELLGVEKDAREQIDNMIASLLERRELLAKTGKHLDLLAKYPLFDLTALTLRDVSTHPLLVVHTLYIPEMQFHVLPALFGSKDRIKSIVPKIFEKYFFKEFSDVLEVMCRRADDRGADVHSKIVSTFRGMIPKSTKEKIELAREDFGENIFLVSQAKWVDYGDRESLPNYSAYSRWHDCDDPLCIGLRDGLAWLIDAFDLTSIEQEVLRKFVLVKKE